MRQVKVIVEKHPDGYVAFPLGMKGIIVGEGDSYEEALTDVKSAIQFRWSPCRELVSVDCRSRIVCLCQI
jgi:hypothetical protein